MTSPTAETRRYDGDLTRQQVVRWRNALFVVFGLSGLAVATWLGRVPAVRDVLGATTLEMGLLVTGLSVGSIVGITFSSHLIAALGARRTVLASLGTVAVGLTIAGLSTDLGVGFVGIVLGLAVFGLGNGLCDVGMNVSGAAAERVLGKTVMPLFHAAFSLGTMVGALLSAGAEALDVPVSVHVTVLAVAIAATALVVTRWMQSEDLGHAPVEGDAAGASGTTGGWRSRLAVWRTPGTVLIGLIVLGMATAEGSANDWLALAMVDGHGLENAAGTVVFFVFVTAMTITRVAGSPLLDRFGRVPMLRFSAVSAALGLLLVIVAPEPWLAIVGVVFWGAGSALGFPVGLSAAADDSRNAAARVSAVATIGYVAFLAMPPVIGFLGEHVGLLNGLWVVLVLIAVAGLASGAAREPSRR
ncbi:fucose permease [Frigoribacterium sp. PvP120]|jgi:fucose permease|uniref:MFS transporter n=1 Tax=unclassified Frigoribacterium TaxID=2627005 RepID=UPI001AE4E66D|nr:MFS transporter [Frigoribacterium sp. PvP121]MBP1240264.1 fucose permease [Frigoribacterium sp. PvP121]